MVVLEEAVVVTVVTLVEAVVGNEANYDAICLRRVSLVCIVVANVAGWSL